MILRPNQNVCSCSWRAGSHQRDRYAVTLATRGGTRSRSGPVKRFDTQRCDVLFVHVGDGRRWFIPSHAVEGGSGLLLGGPKYEALEIERDRPLNALARRGIATLRDARRDSGAVKRDGL